MAPLSVVAANPESRLTYAIHQNFLVTARESLKDGVGQTFTQSYLLHFIVLRVLCQDLKALRILYC